MENRDFLPTPTYCPTQPSAKYPLGTYYPTDSLGASLSNIAILRKQLEAKVEISDLGDISYYLGIEITYNRSKRTLILL